MITTAITATGVKCGNVAREGTHRHASSQDARACYRAQIAGWDWSRGEKA